VQKDAKRIRNKTVQVRTMQHRGTVVPGRAEPSQMVSLLTRLTSAAHNSAHVTIIRAC
jgi:hypothetical protein